MGPKRDMSINYIKLLHLLTVPEATMLGLQAQQQLNSVSGISVLRIPIMGLERWLSDYEQ